MKTDTRIERIRTLIEALPQGIQRAGLAVDLASVEVSLCRLEAALVNPCACDAAVSHLAVEPKKGLLDGMLALACQAAKYGALKSGPHYLVMSPALNAKPTLWLNCIQVYSALRDYAIDTDSKIEFLRHDEFRMQLVNSPYFLHSIPTHFEGEFTKAIMLDLDALRAQGFEVDAFSLHIPARQVRARS